MSDILALQDELKSLVERCAQTEQRMIETDKEFSDVIAGLVDSTTKTRPALFARRKELVELRATLADELVELRRRKYIATLAPFELAVIQAQEEFDIRVQEERQARLAAGAAAQARMSMWNSHRRGGPTPEGDKKLLEIEVEKTRTQVEGGLALSRLSHARHVLESAKKNLEDTRRELDAGKD